MINIFKLWKKIHNKRLWPHLKSLPQYLLYRKKSMDVIQLEKKPKNDQILVNYYTCLKFHFLLLQGVCDYKKSFLNVRV